MTTDLRALADAFVAAEKAYNEKPSMEAAQAYVVAKRKLKSAASPEAIIGLLDRIRELEQFAPQEAVNLVLLGDEHDPC